ncbi:YigZ family protein [Microlunatus soli]|uniref:Uncharacterized protein, YigZ family n=1 Tax=Microlunatus soli TaxID=630515 RepID=A0A1H1TF95_9ACTN|nr:YigZ family protein [Microlunatus soli]SDS58209.1 uncharacterized protein, YigZ family [Microlunatus soli]
MITGYTTIGAAVEAEIEDRRSRFICRLAPVTDEDAARSVITAVRAEHWDARHHCTAFVLGPDRSTRRSNDDGEPAGTAGAPMLQTLEGADITDVVAVVTRYFGGTLLGSGGLIRAYGSATRAAIDRATLRHFTIGELLEITADHATAPRLDNDLRERGVEILGIEYGARVTLRIAVSAGELDPVRSAIATVSHGDAVVRSIGTAWRPD